jgi:hypothetical protein
METTSVMAVLNVMTLINVDPSNTPQTGKQIPIKGVITCSTKGAIYLITCPCGKNCVDKTKRKLKVRISEHRSTISCKNSTYPVAANLLEENHSILSLRYIGTEHVPLRRRR